MQCARLTALPMPLPAPVMMATCPSNRRPGSKLPLPLADEEVPPLPSAGGGGGGGGAAAVCWLLRLLEEHSPRVVSVHCGTRWRDIQAIRDAAVPCDMVGGLWASSRRQN